ncbi:MAG: FAD-binding oxidoreductase [Clostridiales Family XIII bacterium]|jgi:sarcosine oxidase subunit beta|nr:FAD-binding oxidoreductase [Clostridiales Family XIII bacterium]
MLISTETIGKKGADAIVIGGGVMGCAAAYRLAKEGLSVLLLEKTEICADASGRNAGGVRQSARDVRELPLAMYGVQNIWPALGEELGVDVEYVREGNLRLGRTEAHLEKLKALAESSKKVGLDVRMVTGDEAREICPYMSDDVLGASWCPTDGYANPLHTTIGFYRKALAYGAVAVTGVTVLGLGKAKGRIRYVYTDNGVYEAGRVLVAAGYASRAIVNTVGIDVPVEREDEEVFVTEQLPPMFDQVLGTAEADFYGHQTKHGSFLLGGVSGLQHFTSNHDDHPTEAYTAPSLVRGIIRFFPSFANVKIIRCWSGQFDTCVDGVPVISNVEEAPGLTLAFAFTGHGFGISPAVSIAVKELMLDGASTSIDISGLRYDRFKAKQ